MTIDTKLATELTVASSSAFDKVIAGNGATLVSVTPAALAARVGSDMGRRDIATATAVAAALSDGEIGVIAGLSYLKDSSATGSASCTNDLSVDGLVPYGSWTPGHFGNGYAAMFLAAAGRDVHIHFPAGDHAISAPLTLTTAYPIKITGDNAKIVCTDCDGFVIDQSGASDKVSCFIGGIEFRTTVNGTRTAITYTGGGTSALGQQLQVRGCAFKGNSNSLAWEYGIEATDSNYGSVTESFFRGNTSDLTKMKRAVKLTDTTDFHVTRNHIYWAETGVEVLDFSEGITVAMNHMVPVSTGVIMTGTGNLLWAVDNHISAYSRGIVVGAAGVNGVNHSHIIGNLIFKNNLSTSNFIAIECFGNKPEIIGNEVLIPAGTAAGGTQKGIYLDGMADYSAVLGNMLANMDEGIELASGCLYPNLVGNRFLTVTTYINDLGSSGKHVSDAQHGFVSAGYTASALGDVSSAVNTTGKLTGKIVRNTDDDKLYSADGSLAASPWRSAEAGTTITPS